LQDIEKKFANIKVLNHHLMFSTRKGETLFQTFSQPLLFAYVFMNAHILFPESIETARVECGDGDTHTHTHKHKEKENK
jgi:hypothetical protein